MYKVIKSHHASTPLPSALQGDSPAPVHNSVETVESPLKGLDLNELAQLFATELDTLRQEAQKQGYQQGLAKAQQEQAQFAEALRKDADQYLSALKALLDEIPQAFADYLQTQQAELVEIIAESVFKILGEAASNQTLIQQVVSTAIAKCSAEHAMVIHLSAADNTLLEQMNFWTRYPRFKQLECIVDPTLDVGGCVIETPQGKLDARLSKQLERFLQILHDVYQQGGRG